jgi:hypothetical protein
MKYNLIKLFAYHRDGKLLFATVEDNGDIASEKFYEKYPELRHEVIGMSYMFFTLEEVREWFVNKPLSDYDMEQIRRIQANAKR